MRPALRLALRVALGGGDFAYDAIPNIAAAYGMRRLRSAYTGNLLRLRRASDNTEQDFGYVANGDLDAAAIATFLAATSGFVVTWYDQSGNARNATQSTAANQPLYVASGQNSKPIARFDGTNDNLDHGLSLGSGVLSSSFAVVKRNGGTANYQLILYANQALLTARGDSQVFWGCHFGTRIDSSVSLDGAWKVIASVVRAPADIDLVTNGVVENKTNGSGYTLTGAQKIGSSAGAQFAAIDLAELVVCQGAVSAAQRAAAQLAANAYWGVY